MGRSLLGFDEFVGRYRYPGRGIVLGCDTAGAGFAAYWLTGRSEASRARRMVVGPDVLEIADTSAGAVDPLRHYRAIIRTGHGRIVVGNGTQVSQVVADLAAATPVFDALTALECKPDSPILTPRITATALVESSGLREVVVSGAVAHPRRPGPQGSVNHTLHVAAPAPGDGYAACTYAGDATAVMPSGRPVMVEVDAPWPDLLARIWNGLDPQLRVAAAVVPLTADLREGQFTGCHEPVILLDGASRTAR